MISNGSSPNLHRTFIQSCIESDCQAHYGLNERVYTCPRCGGLLDIVPSIRGLSDPGALRALWHERLSSREPQDRSGVWRFRELLPFALDVESVTLQEGNTPLYEAPQSADYCRLDSLQLKHQGLNPTGSFKDTGMTTAITQLRSWPHCQQQRTAAAGVLS